MAGIIIPEQEMVSLGESRIRPRETYSADPKAIQNQYMDRVRNANQLAEALSGLSSTFGEIDKKQQALANAQELAASNANTTVDQIRGASQTAGGTGGAWTQFFDGYRRADPAVVLQADQNRGQAEFAKFMGAYKPYQDYLANRSDADPNSRVAEYNRIVGEARAAYEKENPGKSFGFFAGWGQAAKANENTQTAAALQQYVERTQAIAKENAGRAAVMENVPAQWQNRVYAISQEANINPAKISQFVSIENPSWNPAATSPTGVRGLTQTTRERYEDIKQRIARTNPEIAARMKDRTDPESSMIALAFEIPRMEAIAKNILGREPKTSETYLLWNLGVGGGSDILKAIAQGKLDQPSYSTASDPGSLSAMKNNKGLYEGKTVGEAMNLINQKMKVDSPYHVKTRPLGAMAQGIYFTEQTGIPKEASKWYNWNDFKNSGQTGGAGRVDSRIVAALEQASNFLGRKISITSAHRKTSYNAGVGGAGDSRHVHGDALDIAITDPKEQKEMIKFFSSMGVQGIGVYKGWLHIDLGKPRAWLGKDNNTPSIGLEEVQRLQAEGRQHAQAGGYAPARGFNNAQMTPFQSRVDRIASQFGLSYTDARTVVIESTKTHALNLTAAGNVSQGYGVLNDMISSYGSVLPPSQLNELNNARTAVVQLANSANTARQTANKNEAYEWTNRGIKLLGSETDPQKRQQILSEYLKTMPKTEEGRKAADDLRAKGINFVTVDDKSSEANYSDLKQTLHLPDWWKRVTGRDEAPQNELEGVRALEQSGLTMRLNPKDLRQLVSDKFAFQRSPFGTDKDGKQPAIENMWTAYGKLASDQITATLLSRLELKTGADSDLIKRATEPWERATKLQFSEFMNSLAYAARQSNPLGELDIRSIAKEASELTNEWAKIQIQRIKEAPKTTSANPSDPTNTERLTSLAVQSAQNPNSVLKNLIQSTGTPASGPVSFVDQVNKQGKPLSSYELQALKLPQGSFIRSWDAKKGQAEFVVPINGKLQTVYFRPSQPMDQFEQAAPSQAPASQPTPPAPTPQQGSKIEVPEGASFTDKTTVLLQKSLERSPPPEMPDVMGALRNVGSVIGSALKRGQEETSKRNAETRMRSAFQRWLQTDATELEKYIRMDLAAQRQYFDFWKTDIYNKK